MKRCVLVDFLRASEFVSEKPFELVCPTCGFEYTHPKEVVRLLGWESREDGPLKEGEVPDPSPLRGDGFRIVFWGECGHNFGVDFSFHKGNTFVSAVPLGDNSDIAAAERGEP